MLKTNEKGAGTLGNILAIIAVILIIGIGIWGTITAVRFASKMADGSSSFFGKSKKKAALSITLPKTAVANNEKLSITFSYPRADAKGLYSFTYGCTNGFELHAPISTDGAYGKITCEVPYGVPGTETRIVVLPKNSLATEVAIPVSFRYSTNEGIELGHATGTLYVTHEAEKKKTATTTASTGTQGNVSEENPAGSADLTARIVSVETSQGTTIVRFDVKNVGNSHAGSWRFMASLPSSTSPWYESPLQAPLGPGNGVIFTLSFTNDYGGNVSITVDPDNTVRESNENNNTLVHSLGGSYVPYQPYQGYLNY